MEKSLSLLVAFALLALPAVASTNVTVSGGTLRNTSGQPLPNGALVVLVASTTDQVFSAPTPGASLQAGRVWASDDRVLAAWEVSSSVSGVAGGFVGSVEFNYAQMAVPNLGAGDQLLLAWFPHATLASPVATPGTAYGTYRVDAQINQSDMTWAAPDDAGGAALALNVITADLSGETPEAATQATLTVAAGSPGATRHSADLNGDGQLDLSELLRVIELYNTRTGSTRTGRYRVQVGTDDGFSSDPATAADAVVTLSAYHSADSNRDGQLGLAELLRVIELYNFRSGTARTGQYHAQAGSEDGFNSGP